MLAREAAKTGQFDVIERDDNILESLDMSRASVRLRLGGLEESISCLSLLAGSRDFVGDERGTGLLFGSSAVTLRITVKGFSALALFIILDLDFLEEQRNLFVAWLLLSKGER
jgi:hypothetical protein